MNHSSEFLTDLHPRKSQAPFPFILAELEPLRLTSKKIFGFTHVYLEDRLLFSLRDADKQRGSNGMWLYTTTDQVDSLAAEFSDLSRRQIWRSGKKAWIILASRLPNFEEHALKACELVLRNDQRIGRISRRRPKKRSADYTEVFEL